MPELLMTGEVAELLCVSDHRAAQMCLEGDVPGAVRRSGRWFLPAAWVRAEIKRREKAAGHRGIGRPTKLTQRVRAGAAAGAG